MKSRSELREIVMKILYQVFILKEASVEFDVEKLKKEQLEIERKYWEERDSDIALVHNMTRAKETELRFEYEITGEEEKIYIDDPEEMDQYVSSSKYVPL